MISKNEYTELLKIRNNPISYTDLSSSDMYYSLFEKGYIDYEEKNYKYKYNITESGIAAISEFEQNKRNNKLQEEANKIAKQSLESSNKANQIAEESNKIANKANSISQESLEASKEANQIANESLKKARRANIISIVSAIAAVAAAVAAYIFK